MNTEYPEARRLDLTETMHGVEVADPYRWLEEDASAETRAWVDAQNAETRRVLDAVPQRDRIRARLNELSSTGLVGTPDVRGARGARTISRRSRLSSP